MYLFNDIIFRLLSCQRDNAGPSQTDFFEIDGHINIHLYLDTLFACVTTNQFVKELFVNLKQNKKLPALQEEIKNKNFCMC